MHSAMKVLHTCQFLLPSLTHSTSSSSFQSSLSHIQTNHVLELENHILQTGLEELKTIADAEQCLQEHWQAQYQAVEAHCTLHAHANEQIAHQMSTSSHKKKRQKVHTDSQLLTSPEAMYNLNLRNVSSWPKNRLLHKSGLTEKWQRGSICWNSIITLHSRLLMLIQAQGRSQGYCSSTCIGQHQNHPNPHNMH